MSIVCKLLTSISRVDGIEWHVVSQHGFVCFELRCRSTCCWRRRLSGLGWHDDCCTFFSNSIADQRDRQDKTEQSSRWVHDLIVKESLTKGMKNISNSCVTVVTTRIPERMSTERQSHVNHRKGKVTHPRLLSHIIMLRISEWKSESLYEVTVLVKVDTACEVGRRRRRRKFVRSKKCKRLTWPSRQWRWTSVEEEDASQSEG